MANRPVRNRNRTTPNTTAKRTQAEINRTKPVGVLSLEVMNEKSIRVKTINVRLPDGDIYEFCHLPMTVAEAEEFFRESDASGRLAAMKTMLSEQLVNKDGSSFIPLKEDGSLEIETWDNIDVKIMDNLVDAILGSAREEGGEG